MSTVPMNSIATSQTSTPRIVVASWIVVAVIGAVLVAAAVVACIYAGLPTPDLVIGS